MSTVQPASTPRDEFSRLLALAWPVVVGQIGIIALGVVDVMMLGRVSEQAVAAAGIGNTWSFGSLVVGLGAAMGIDPLVAQAYGAGDAKAAGRALLRGAVVLGALSVPIMALHAGADLGLRLLGQPDTIVAGAAAYCRIMTLGVVPFLGFALFRQFLQGSGSMRPAMWVLVVGNVLNAFLCDALIFGRYGLPALEIEGAAWATVSVRWAMLALLFAIGVPQLRRAWPDDGLAITWADVRRTAAITLPTGWQLGLEVWAFGSAAFLAGWIDDLAVAAHTVAMSIISVLFMVPLGISAAAATRVGNLVGARQPWTSAATAALAAVWLVMASWALLLLSVPELLVSAYTPNQPDVIAAAVAVFPIAAAFQLFDGTQVVTFGVLRGLGDTQRPAWFNIIGHWVLGLPIGAALAFGFGWGLPGLWAGLSVGLASVASLLLLRLRWHAAQPLPVRVTEQA